MILWSRSPRLFETEALPKIAAMSGKMIVDTGAFADTAHALTRLQAQVDQGRLHADLAWSRITRWRETVSQAFENQDCLKALSKYSEAVVQYGGQRPGTDVLYLAAWLQNGMARLGNTTKVRLVRAEGAPIGGILLSGAGECDVSIRSDASGAVTVRANGLETRMIFPEPTDILSLQEELSITARDAAFEDALRTAASFPHES